MEKDEGDALFKVWAHEPLKGLFVPLPAWIITPGFPVMCCRWYIEPHLLLFYFHLARSSQSSINLGREKKLSLWQDFCTANNWRLRSNCGDGKHTSLAELEEKIFTTWYTVFIKCLLILLTARGSEATFPVASPITGFYFSIFAAHCSCAVLLDRWKSK